MSQKLTKTLANLLARRP